MKITSKILMFTGLALFALFARPSTALAAPLPGVADDKVVFGGNFILGENEVLDGDLTVIGGAVVTEEGSHVRGNMFVLGGTAQVNGAVEGDLSVMGGSVILSDTARVEGDVSTLGGSLQRSQGAQVGGAINRQENRPFSMDLPDMIRQNPIARFSSFLAQTLAMAALAVLLALAAPNALRRTAEAGVAQPAATGGVGLLTLVVAPIAIVILIITILLIPAALISILLLAAAGIFGYIAAGLELGRRIEKATKGSFSPSLAAGIGTFALGLVIGLLNLIPCVGWLLGALVILVGLGATILTRFGTRPYPAAPLTPSYSAYPPAAPTPWAGPAAPQATWPPVTPATPPAAPWAPAATPTPPAADIWDLPQQPTSGAGAPPPAQPGEPAAGGTQVYDSPSDPRS